MPRASAASGALLRGKDPVVARLISSPLDLVASLRTLRAEARADMPRAQLLASLLVATLFAAIGASRPWWSTELPEFPIAVPTVHEFMEPPSITPPGGGAPAAPTRVAVVDPHAVPNVVPEALPSDAIGPTPPSSTVPGGTGAEGTTTPLVPGPVDIRPVAERVPDIWETHDVEPEPLFTPRPEYTDIAQQANVEGTVVLRALVRAASARRTRRPGGGDPRRALRAAAGRGRPDRDRPVDVHARPDPWRGGAGLGADPGAFLAARRALSGCSAEPPPARAGGGFCSAGTRRFDHPRSGS